MATTYTLVEKERRPAFLVLKISFHYDDGVDINNIEIHVSTELLVGLTNPQRKALIKTAVVNRGVTEKRAYDGNALADALLPLLTQTDFD